MKPLPIQAMPYKGVKYWIDGTAPNEPGQPGCYRYYLERVPGAEPIQSDLIFDRILTANDAARKAIDAFSALPSGSPPSSSSPTRKTRSTVSRGRAKADKQGA